MLVDKKLMDSLSAQAKVNPRLRQALDLRTTPDDQSQRILNAVEPGTILPIHRHRGSTETIVVLRGKVVQHYYDDNGNKTASFELAPGSAQVGMSVPVGQWHALESLEEGSVIFECKDGAYAPLQPSEFLNVSLLGTPKVLTTPSWQLYQQLCDTVFGSGAVTIKPTTRDNNIIGTQIYTRVCRLPQEFPNSP